MVGGEAVLGVIALAFSFPLVVVAVLFATRPALRVELRKGDLRVFFIGFFVIETGVAALLWGIFLLAALHR